MGIMVKLLTSSQHAAVRALYLLFVLAFHPPLATGQADSPVPSPPRRKEISDEGIKARTVAIIIASLISSLSIMCCAAVLLTGHCVRRQTRQLTLTATLESHGGAADRHRLHRFHFHRHVPTGLDPSIVDKFPALVYSEVKKEGFSLECAVCLSKFENAESLRLLPECCHVFHADCIETWLSIRVTCPVCRCNLDPKPDNSLTPVSPEREPESAGSVRVDSSIVMSEDSELLINRTACSTVRLTLGTSR